MLKGLGQVAVHTRHGPYGVPCLSCGLGKENSTNLSSSKGLGFRGLGSYMAM